MKNKEIKLVGKSNWTDDENENPIKVMKTFLNSIQNKHLRKFMEKEFEKMENEKNNYRNKLGKL